MAGRKKKKTKQRKPFFDDLSPHTKQAIGAVAFVVLAIFFTLALFDYAGSLGSWVRITLEFLFGKGAYLAPFVCVFYVYALLNPREEDQEVSMSKIIGIALLFLALLGLLDLYENMMGGWLGYIVEWPLAYLMGGIATGVVLGAFVLVSLFLTFNTGIPNPFAKREVEEEDEDEDLFNLPQDGAAEESSEEETADENEEDAEEKPKKSMGERLGLSSNKSPSDFVVSSFQGPYDPPPLSLLNKDKGRAKSGDVKANSVIIKRTDRKSVV